MNPKQILVELLSLKELQDEYPPSELNRVRAEVIKEELAPLNKLRAEIREALVKYFESKDV